MADGVRIFGGFLALFGIIAGYIYENFTWWTLLLTSAGSNILEFSISAGGTIIVNGIQTLETSYILRFWTILIIAGAILCFIPKGANSKVRSVFAIIGVVLLFTGAFGYVFQLTQIFSLVDLSTSLPTYFNPIYGYVIADGGNTFLVWEIGMGWIVTLLGSIIALGGTVSKSAP